MGTRLLVYVHTLKWMEATLRWSLLVLVTAGLVSSLGNSSAVKDDFKQCETAVKKWASSSLEEVKEDKHKLRDLLFFLHIPRTGGRTYFHCFLKKLYSDKLECPRSYDKLRFNPRKTNCRLLVTHDDYSVMSKLPKEKTSVVTILRNPVHRVFSTYEFSIEVAARFLVHPNLTSALHFSGRLRKKTNGVNTLDIWPWKYLVPWMREDLFARRDARMQEAPNFIRSNDSYSMVDIIMPLYQYINDPIALDIIHNGATFQVAGLTNNSHVEESHEVRHCVQKYSNLGTYVLEVAKKRVDNMLYVGLTEDHDRSATVFAEVIGTQVISQFVGSNASTDHSANEGSEQDSSLTDSELENDPYQSSRDDQNTSNYGSPNTPKSTKKIKLTVGELMKAYKDCITKLREAQALRRNRSLMKISPANFTKEARLKVPESVLRQIISLNSLDVELYKYAQDIFARQRNCLIQESERQNSILINSYSGAHSWKNVSMASVLFVLFLVLVLFLNARRRTKIKI
ncbi:hypothetical protein Nepgr_000642 [Nepenthes gracilis]|uniref:Sulfotransferase n=1 Tax=Nepenthes gracilis TaxID=150966 RepID=A0AAD3RX16_NEPGR|nr:hypothetical protein Nepgr_000642 [Nepenthes gracilis]